MAGPFDNATDPLMPSGGNSSTPGQSSGTVSLGGDSGTGDLGYYTGNAMAASLLAQSKAAHSITKMISRCCISSFYAIAFRVFFIITPVDFMSL